MARATETPSASERAATAVEHAMTEDALVLLALRNAPTGFSEWARQLVKATVLPNERALRPVVAALAADGRIVAREIHEGNETYLVPANVALECLRAASEDGRLDALIAEASRGQGSRYFESWRYAFGEDRAARAGSDLRLALVRDDRQRARAIIDGMAGVRTDDGHPGGWLVVALGLEAEARYLGLLGEAHARAYFAACLELAVAQLFAIPEALLETAREDEELAHATATYLAIFGRREEAIALSAALRRAAALEVAVLAAFFAGDLAGAYEAGESAIAAMPAQRKHRQLAGLPGLCHALARAAAAQRVAGAFGALGAQAMNAKAAKAGLPWEYHALTVLYLAAREEPSVREARLRRLEQDLGYRGARTWSLTLTVGLCHAWLAPTARCPEWLRPHLASWATLAKRAGNHFLASELSTVEGALAGVAPPEGSLAASYRRREPWEIALDALETLATGGPRVAPAPAAAQRAQLVWTVLLNENNVDISPRLVTARSARGKVVSLARLLEGKVTEIAAGTLDDRDARVLAAVDRVEAGGYSQKTVPHLGARALLELVDHPRVERPDGTRLTVTLGEPELQLEPDGEKLRLVIHPRALAKQSVAHEEVSHAHVTVFARTPALESVAKALLDGELVIPGEARDRLGAVLRELSPRVRIRGSGDLGMETESQDADPRPTVLLRWDGTTLAVRLGVAPLGVDGPLVRAGQGSPYVVATIGGRALGAERDLEAERARFEALLDACPTVASLPQQHGEARALDLALALDTMLELDAMGEEVVLAWPRGRALAAPIVRGSAHVRVKVHEASEWLSVDVELPVDEGRVLGFAELMERRRGRYVELDGSRFIALTEELARRLDAIESLGKTTATGIRAPHVVLSLLDELTRELGERTVDPAAQARLERLERAAEINPRVPRAFAAELRDYQRAGFTWLARLAEAGLGACLADDMGLGKTVQTLALLVHRSARGPALVIAPTSVASNWLDETKRFAPTLRAVSLLGATDREEILQDLGPGSLLVVSYGVLVSEAERLSQIEFDTVVLDEAHYLKNPRTQRAKAALGLKAAFRLALTGTPIENHLGELWSVVHAAVPGLLGPERTFEHRFASPIREGDRERTRQLRAILKPFLLRRTKAQVLDELPERTEITLRVTPTEAERAYYEALRRAALAELQQQKGGDAKSRAQSRFQILAHILRLRQASIDPRLVDPDAPAGAKLDELLELITSLRAEGHRALVFTQFLEAMARVRGRLDAAGITYLDLDGGTPEKERGARIAAFQAGEADVFVMSLKAGGIGVNLTAADYVIHLDPWWNPAVEDQATGRAHRIGQSRPVTVYRLVTEGSIEERILALHHEKRALAEDLLGQMDKAKSLDLDALRALL